MKTFVNPSSGSGEAAVVTKVVGVSLGLARNYSAFSQMDSADGANSNLGMRGAGGGTAPPLEIYTNNTSNAYEEHHGYLPVSLPADYVSGENFVIRIFAGQALLPLGAGASSYVTLGATKASTPFAAAVQATPVSHPVTAAPAAIDFTFNGSTFVAGQTIWLQITVANDELTGDGMEFVIWELSFVGPCTQ